MKKINIILFAFAIVSLSCTRYTDLNDSIYVNDPYIDGLPAYTEWGYNTFGANYDRVIRKFHLKLPFRTTKSGS